MRADYFDRFAGRFEGGLDRLRRHGMLFTDAHQNHAVTATAVGHAAIATGTYPAKHGIVANAWWDRLKGRSVYAVEDSLPILGLTNAQGTSPALLLRSTVGDWLKDASPAGKVFSVSLKDRASILMAGRLADGAYWYYDPLGFFVTSTQYQADRYPAWLARFNGDGDVRKGLGGVWDRLVDSSTYTASREDAFPAEADGVHTTFPHTLSSDSMAYFGEVRYAPIGDQLSFSLAMRLIQAERLGKDSQPDILFLGASAADGIGHLYGPYSQEIEDYYLRLDIEIGILMDLLDREVGAGNYVLVLTSDHGVMPMPEELKRRGVDAARVDTRALLTPILEATKAAFAMPDLKIVNANGLYIDHRSRTLPPDTLRLIRRFIADTLMQHPDVADAFTYEELADPATPARPFLAVFRRSFHPDRSPDVTPLLKEFRLPVVPRGTTHESPYPYDTHIPIVFYSARVEPRTIDRPVHAVDIAPTIAQLLGIPMPADLDGIPLPEVMQAWQSPPALP